MERGFHAFCCVGKKEAAISSNTGYYHYHRAIFLFFGRRKTEGDQPNERVPVGDKGTGAGHSTVGKKILDCNKTATIQILVIEL